MLFPETEWPVNVGGVTVNQPQHRGDFWSVYSQHVAAIRDVASGEHGVVGAARRTIKYNGWSARSSPFWELLWMRASFYSCFGICLLHLEHLGLLKVRLHFFN
jgi:hypothetical protein